LEGLVTAPFGCIVNGRGASFTTYIPTMPDISVNYAAPWDKRYWAKDYADEALRILTISRWPVGSLVVEHTDPESPTHWRVVPVRGIQQPGW